MHATSNPIAIALHAGAGESYRNNPGEHDEIRTFLQALVAEAETQLSLGANAIDVVTDVTAALEDFPLFNAGRGASLNIIGEHELEAAVIDGSSGEYRAVLNTKNTKNPVRLAHALLVHDDVAIMAGRAADRLADKRGLDIVSNTYFCTPGKYEYWLANRAKYTKLALEQHGTVGAVALDRSGNLAAANSTGGTMFKRVGRIGDTAINGAGIYADKSYAIVCSGSGEAILKTLVAKSTAASAHHGMALDEAARSALLDSAVQSITSSCGIIAVSRSGAISIQSNARTFAVASAGTRTPPVAQFIRSTLTYLKQLVIFEDELVRTSFAKYPTMKGQVLLELRKPLSTFESLDRETIDRVWLLAQKCAVQLKETFKTAFCSCLVVENAMHLFPHSTTLQLGPNSFTVGDDDLWQRIQAVSGNSLLELHMIDTPARDVIVQLATRSHVLPGFPAPAIFHQTYPGYMSAEPGLRAVDLNDLVVKAKLFADAWV